MARPIMLFQSCQSLALWLTTLCLMTWPSVAAGTAGQGSDYLEVINAAIHQLEGKPQRYTIIRKDKALMAGRERDGVDISADVTIMEGRFRLDETYPVLPTVRSEAYHMVTVGNWNAVGHVMGDAANVVEYVANEPDELHRMPGVERLMFPRRDLFLSRHVYGNGAKLITEIASEGTVIRAEERVGNVHLEILDSKNLRHVWTLDPGRMLSVVEYTLFSDGDILSERALTYDPTRDTPTGLVRVNELQYDNGRVVLDWVFVILDHVMLNDDPPESAFTVEGVGLSDDQFVVQTNSDGSVQYLDVANGVPVPRNTGDSSTPLVVSGSARAVSDAPVERVAADRLVIYVLVGLAGTLGTAAILITIRSGRGR